MSVEVRPETPDDVAAIDAVVRAAFGQPDEARLVEALRAGADPQVSLVAVADAAIVGHVFFSPVTVDGTDLLGSDLLGMGLGPLAVAPAHQHRGIGSRLSRDGLNECLLLGAHYAVVLGHPGYYPRFGFTPAANRGLRCAFPAPPEAFMTLELVPGALDGVTGTVLYHPAFGS